MIRGSHSMLDRPLYKVIIMVSVLWSSYVYHHQNMISYYDYVAICL